MANTFESKTSSMENWFTFNPSDKTWTKHKLAITTQLPSKPHWFLIPIIGELYLFLPEQTLRYDSETSKWMEVNSLIELPLQDIEFLSIAYYK